MQYMAVSLLKEIRARAKRSSLNLSKKPQGYGPIVHLAAGSSIAVIVINHNTEGELRTCLGNLSSRVADGNLIVFDNHSGDGSAEMVKQEYPKVSLLQSEVNLGYGAAANRAIGSCAADYVVLTNSDVTFNLGSPAVLGEYLDAHPEVGVVGPKLLNADGTLQRSAFPFPGSWAWVLDNDVACGLLRHFPGAGDYLLRAWKYAHERTIPWAKGAVLAIRREAFNQVGGFDEAYFMYYEEADLCWRLGRAGWQTQFTPKVEAVHLGGASTTKARSDMRLELFASFTLFARRHYSVLHFLILVVVWKAIFAMRLCRDLLRLLTPMNSSRRATICADMQGWARALRWSPRELRNRETFDTPPDPS